jgi:hypothetical protein
LVPKTVAKLRVGKACINAGRSTNPPPPTAASIKPAQNAKNPKLSSIVSYSITEVLTYFKKTIIKDIRIKVIKKAQISCFEICA